MELFVACAPGLERLLAAELRKLCATKVCVQPGGVELKGDAHRVVQICWFSGLANHLRLRVGEPFEVRHFDKLVRRVAALPWQSLLKPGTAVEVAAVCRKSRLYHSQAVAQRVEQGIARALGAGADSGRGPVQQVHVRMVRDVCVVSLELAGEPLHKRGWRQRTAKAPLREDLARALLVASGWKPGQSLLDPMMGSGTLVIEAATMTCGLAPGRLRRFACEHTALDVAPLFRQLRSVRDQSLATAVKPPGGIRIVGRDHAQGAVAAARENAARAGVEQLLELQCANLEQPWPSTQSVVTNPPYGIRVGRSEPLVELYRALGEQVAAAGASLAVVIADRRFVRALQLPVVPRAQIDHGGLKVELFTT